MIQVSELLRGLEAGKLQSCGYMQIIPLICDTEELLDNRYGTPRLVKTTKNEDSHADFSTSAYGSMVFKNQSDNPVIIPNHFAVITKESAQDHTMSSSGLLKSGQKKTYDNALCIESSQAGLISGAKHDYFILPYSLRKTAFNLKDGKGYDRLWKSIGEFNADYGVASDSGHLKYFYEKFERSLDAFVAEFENIKNQVGAIILLNGVLVGIERTPNYSYWNDIWQPLIRGCYGSLAIYYALNQREMVSRTRVPIDLDRVNSIDDLVSEYVISEATEHEVAKNLVSEVMANSLEDIGTQETMTVSPDNTLGLHDVRDDNFVGQYVKDSIDGRVLYASIVSDQHYLKSEVWQKAPDFKM